MITHCQNCGQEKQPHELDRCRGCGRMICVGCDYIPTIASVCRCPGCRQKIIAQQYADYQKKKKVQA